MRRRNRLLFLTLLLALCCQIATGQAKLPQVYHLSLKTDGFSRLPMLPVKLSDGKTYLFYLDTGAGACFIDQEIGRSLGLPIRNFTSAEGIRYEAVEPGAILGGKLPISTLALLLVDMSRIRQTTPEFGGILGLTLMKLFALRFDFHEQTVDFILDGKVAGTFLEPPGAERFSLSLSGEELWYVPGAVDDDKLPMVLDTGAETTGLSSKKALSSLKPRGSIKGRLVNVVDNERKHDLLVPETLLRLNQLTLGTLVWKEPVLAFLDQRKDTGVTYLGIDFFRQYQVLLDFPARTMYLTPDPKYVPDAEEWNGVGATFFVAGEKEVRIAYVYDPSPANAVGLKGNDEIVAVDGQTVEQRSPQKTLEYLKSLKKEGQEVVLRVRNDRDRKEREVRLKVVKLL